MNEYSIYRFNIKKLNGEEISLSEYSNKVLLIVNTATACGFTPQLKDLEDLRKEFENTDFEILAFPSNDFGGQEPLDDNELANFCQVNYGVNYQMFRKIRVRGTYAHPLYKFLADKKLNGRVRSQPKWNFHKYLINRKGEVVDFFYPFTKPNSAKIKRKINRLLSAQN